MKQLFNRVRMLLFEGESKWHELIRFGIVGVSATAAHYGLYLLFLFFLPRNFAYTIAYLICLVANFYLSNSFTFKTKPSIRKGIGFGLSHGINYVLHIGLLNFFVWAGLSNEIAPIPVFLIVVPVNFILVRTVLKSRVL